EHLPKILAKQFLEEGIAPLNGVSNGSDAPGLYLGISPPANGPDLIHRHRPDLILNLLFFRENGESVGLLQIRGQLCVGFGGGDTHAAIKLRFLIDTFLDAPGKFNQLLISLVLFPGNIQEEFIHAVGLHIGRKYRQAVLNTLAEGTVFFIIHLLKDDMRADLIGLQRTHAGLYAPCPGFIRTCSYNALDRPVGFAPSADGHRHAVEIIAKLFHLCIEGIHIHMDIEPRPIARMLHVVCYGLISGNVVNIFVKLIRARFWHGRAFILFMNRHIAKEQVIKIYLYVLTSYGIISYWTIKMFIYLDYRV